MRLWKKIISLNLALVMMVTVLPVTAFAALTLDGLTAISSTQSAYTASSDGLYKFYIEATSNGSAASSGDLVLYKNATVAEYFGYTSTSAYTILAPLTAGQEYVVTHTASDGNLDLELSATKLTTSTLSVGSTANVITSYTDPDYASTGYAYVAVEVSSSGWYTLSTPNAYHMQSIPTSVARDEAEKEITVYLDAANTPYYFLVASSLNDMVSVNFSSADIQTISENQDATVTCSETYVTYFKKFVAQSSGQYTITATNPSDFYEMVLCDAEGDLLVHTYGDEYVYEPICATLTAGETYYIGVSGDYWAESDDITFRVSCDIVIEPEPWEPLVTTETITLKTGVSAKDGNEYAKVNISWDDTWFENASTTYIHDLSTATMGLSGAAYNQSNISSALKQLGFDNIQQSNYDYPHTEDDNDVVAYNFATKTIYDDGEEYTLVAVVIKGTSGDEEWYSNFNINEFSPAHAGFQSAATAVSLHLLSYLQENNLNSSNTKLLVTGHSRGAAVANLIAATFTNEGSYYSSPENVFAYTFATPAVSTLATESGYGNIFNILNGEDFVPRVPLDSWGYSRYGIDLWLPSKSYYKLYYIEGTETATTYNTVSSKMSQEYKSLTDTDFSFYDAGTFKVDWLVSDVYMIAPTVSKYYSRPLLSTTTVYEYFNDLADVLIAFENGLSVNTALEGFEYILYESSPNYSSITSFFMTQELINKRVLSAHSMAAYFSWLDSCTSDELFGEKNEWTSNAYERLTVACPVNVYVYDENGALVASVVNEVVVENTLAVYVEDGVKTIDLPAGQEYSVEVVAREEGSVDYSVATMSMSGSNVTTERTMLYDDIVIAAGDKITGKIPSALDADAADYTLTNGTTSLGSPTVIDGAIEADSLYAYVDISITGNGSIDPEVFDGELISITKGETQTFTFTADSGSYISDVLVDAVSVGAVDSYTFEIIDGDHTLSVVFADTDTTSSSVRNTYYDIDLEDADNGEVTVSLTRAVEGKTITITATPDDGYEIDEVIVLDEDDDEIDVDDEGDGEYTFEMPDEDVTVEVTFVAIDDDEDDDTIAFLDVDTDAYYYDAVLWAVENGITNGMTEYLFAPDTVCTRAQAVTFLWNAAGNPTVFIKNPFEDVSADAWYYDAVLWAVSEGITSGTTETTFAPDSTCTRAQIVTFLWNTAGNSVVDFAMDFDDVAADSWYAEAVRWAVSEEITTGMTATEFAPATNCTRGQIVTFLYRYLGE